MQANPRYKALELIQSRTPKSPIDKSRAPAELFAQHVFNKRMMQHYLSKDVYLRLQQCIDHGEILTRDIAGPIANAIKSWAMEHGATHFTHWFQPLTGMAAEKHDAFLELSGDEAIYKFTGEELVQQKPDASAFPHGGLRSTFEARGYTAWDCSSPVFIFETTYGKTLCIPTIFVSYTGEALDYKIPLLKSMAVLDKAATAVCHYFDKSIQRVMPTLGAEQEYFLIDESYYYLRPDLMLTGRTVFGSPPARGHQINDHYFGSIPERAFAFMNQLEKEALLLGIPLKTRHNEVAPSQFECAPKYEEINVAADHGLILMDIIERVAKQHHLCALLHEKPFEKINGSAKHNNWSMNTDTGRNLLSPGSNPRENLMFLAFFTSVIRGVYEYADLLQGSVASLGNDRRIGAREAPPPIISVFIGSKLTKVLKDIETPPRRRKETRNNPYLKLGISKIPELLLDNTDDNRTSPIAFTGNKFEFRAVGSSANSSRAMTVLNAIVAEQLIYFKKKVDSKMNRGRKKEAAILDMIRENITVSKAIRFEGDCSSPSWIKTAGKRGLSLIHHTPYALDAYLSEKTQTLFTQLKIFTPNEIRARHEVMTENYLNKVRIEAEVISELTHTHVIPCALKYQHDLLENIRMAQQAGLTEASISGQIQLAEKVGSHINKILKLEASLQKHQTLAKESNGTQTQTAKYYADKIIPLFDEIRSHVDRLELMLPDEMWPLPKYREMLFSR